MSDAEIIAAFSRGDRRAVELIYDRLIDVIDRTLLRVVGKRDGEHDDLVQNTFEQIILTLSRERFAGQCSLHGWAASIACHVGLNAIRSRSRARRIFAVERDPEAELDYRSPDNVEARVIARRELDDVRRHLADMDQDRAQTVLLYDVMGVSLAETARLTGVSIGAAQSRLARGRVDLRERLSKQGAKS